MKKFMFPVLFLVLALSAIGTMPVISANAAPARVEEAPVALVAPAVIIGLPCDDAILKTIDAFRKNMGAKQFLMTGTTVILIIVPGAAEAQTAMLSIAKEAGMTVTDIAGFESLLRHAGFKPGSTANAKGDWAWSRSSTWSPEKDGCGPMPPPPAAPAQNPAPTGPREGYDYHKNVEFALPTFAILLFAIAFIFIRGPARKRQANA